MDDTDSYADDGFDGVDDEITFGGGAEDDCDIDDDELSGNEDDLEDISLIGKIKSGQKSEIVSVDKTYETYYSTDKVTKPFLTKFERAKILGVRSEMLASGSPALVNVPSHIQNTYDIALLEYKEKKIPLIIKRSLPNGKIEYWRLEDLSIMN